MEATLTFNVDESEVESFIERIRNRWPDLKIAIKPCVIKKAEKKEPEGEFSKEFNQFWESYPRKLNKKLSWNAWNARLNDGIDQATLLLSAKNYAISVNADGTEEKFTLHPSTFLGPNERWKEWIQTRKEPSYRP